MPACRVKIDALGPAPDTWGKEQTEIAACNGKTAAGPTSRFSFSSIRRSKLKSPSFSSCERFRNCEMRFPQDADCQEWFCTHRWLLSLGLGKHHQPPRRPLLCTWVLQTYAIYGLYTLCIRKPLMYRGIDARQSRSEPSEQRRGGPCCTRQSALRGIPCGLLSAAQSRAVPPTRAAAVHFRLPVVSLPQVSLAVCRARVPPLP